METDRLWLFRGAVLAEWDAGEPDAAGVKGSSPRSSGGAVTADGDRVGGYPPMALPSGSRQAGYWAWYADG